MSITEAFIEHLPEIPLSKIEEFTELWVEALEGNFKDKILPFLIEEKLNEYEDEYEEEY